MASSLVKETDYELLDSGNGRKLERFGEVKLIRPAAQAVWSPQHPNIWSEINAGFSRERGMHWSGAENFPPSWHVNVHGITLKLAATDFGHVGAFPEAWEFWPWMAKRLQGEGKDTRAEPLNLFAYSGGATMVAARAGASCCHVDSSQGMVQWARENAHLNALDDAPIRWITDDVRRFLKREIRRGRRYDAIILDPPSFGRGRRGEVFKIGRDLPPLLHMLGELLSNSPRFVLLTCHTPGFTASVLENLLIQSIGPGSFGSGEMMLRGASNVLPLPQGTWASWTPFTEY